MAKESENTDALNKSSDTAQKDDGLSRLTDQLFQQLKPYLPIDTVENIKKGLTEVGLGDHRLPLDIFIPFISNDIFPIKTEEDLKKKLSEGVERGVAFIGSGDIQVGNKLHTDVYANITRASKGIVIKSGVPTRKIFKF